MDTELLPGDLRNALQRLSIARGKNDCLVDSRGRTYIDLFTGCGTVFLGHGRPAIVNSVRSQLDEVWSTGALETPSRRQAIGAIESFFGTGWRLAALYSTGMEAAEFAIRIGREATGRRQIVGFDGSMHGKSVATAFLGWPNERVSLPDFRRLPFVGTESEARILDQLREHLAGGSVAAVFLEPIQGSAGGHAATPELSRGIARACAEHGTLLVVDEILTGFHRTGTAFVFERHGIRPDIVLIGKAMGNGFPVSGVMLESERSIDPAMLPWSTYSGNPLASAAVSATLAEMRSLDMAARVRRIGETVVRELGSIAADGVHLRGAGALWFLELPLDSVGRVVARSLDGGVIVASAGSFIRVLPAATTTDANLERACRVVRAAVNEALG